jgi:hypothetical protein
MSKILKFFDFYSQGPTLRVNGDTRLATNFGSIISLLSLTLLFSGLYFILNDYFSYLTFNVNSFTDNTNTPDIDLKKFKMSILLIDGQGREYENPERLFKISAAYWNVKVNPISTNSYASVGLIDIPTMKCNNYTDPTLNEEFKFYTGRYKSITCLNFDKINKNLTGIFGSVKGYF